MMLLTDSHALPEYPVAHAQMPVEKSHMPRDEHVSYSVSVVPSVPPVTSANVHEMVPDAAVANDLSQKNWERPGLPSFEYRLFSSGVSPHLVKTIVYTQPFVVESNEDCVQVTVSTLLSACMKDTQAFDDSEDPSALKTVENPLNQSLNDPDMACAAELAVVIVIDRDPWPVVSGSSPLGHSLCEQSGPAYVQSHLQP
jgi:hypothetical protein